MKELTGVAIIVIFFALIYGWVMNIVALFGLTAASPLGEIIGRIVGVFLAPVGGIIGLFF